MARDIDDNYFTLADLVRAYAHLTDAEFDGYLDDSLPPKERVVVENHLRTCVRCSREVNAVRTAVALA